MRLQAFSMLTTGMRLMPMPRNATFRDQHLVGHDTSSGVAHVGRLQLGRGDACIGNGFANRLGGERFETAVNVLAGTGHARASDEDGLHGKHLRLGG